MTQAPLQVPLQVQVRLLPVPALRAEDIVDSEPDFIEITSSSDDESDVELMGFRDLNKYRLQHGDVRGPVDHDLEDRVDSNGRVDDAPGVPIIRSVEESDSGSGTGSGSGSDSESDSDPDSDTDSDDNIHELLAKIDQLNADTQQQETQGLTQDREHSDSMNELDILFEGKVRSMVVNEADMLPVERALTQRRASDVNNTGDEPRRSETTQETAESNSNINTVNSESLKNNGTFMSGIYKKVKNLFAPQVQEKNRQVENESVTEVGIPSITQCKQPNQPESSQNGSSAASSSQPDFNDSGALSNKVPFFISQSENQSQLMASDSTFSNTSTQQNYRKNTQSQTQSQVHSHSQAQTQLVNEVQSQGEMHGILSQEEGEQQQQEQEQEQRAEDASRTLSNVHSQSISEVLLDNTTLSQLPASLQTQRTKNPNMESKLPSTATSKANKPHNSQSGGPITFAKPVTLPMKTNSSYKSSASEKLGKMTPIPQGTSTKKNPIISGIKSSNLPRKTFNGPLSSRENITVVKLTPLSVKSPRVSLPPPQQPQKELETMDDVADTQVLQTQLVTQEVSDFSHANISDLEEEEDDDSMDNKVREIIDIEYEENDEEEFDDVLTKSNRRPLTQLPSEKFSQTMLPVPMIERNHQSTVASNEDVFSSRHRSSLGSHSKPTYENPLVKARKLRRNKRPVRMESVSQPTKKRGRPSKEKKKSETDGQEKKDDIDDVADIPARPSKTIRIRRQHNDSGSEEISESESEAEDIGNISYQRDGSAEKEVVEGDAGAAKTRHSFIDRITKPTAGRVFNSENISLDSALGVDVGVGGGGGGLLDDDDSSSSNNSSGDDERVSRRAEPPKIFSVVNGRGDDGGGGLNGVKELAKEVSEAMLGHLELPEGAVDETQVQLGSVGGNGGGNGGGGLFVSDDDDDEDEELENGVPLEELNRQSTVEKDPVKKRQIASKLAKLAERKRAQKINEYTPFSESSSSDDEEDEDSDNDDHARAEDSGQFVVSDDSVAYDTDAEDPLNVESRPERSPKKKRPRVLESDSESDDDDVKHHKKTKKKNKKKKHRTRNTIFNELKFSNPGKYFQDENDRISEVIKEAEVLGKGVIKVELDEEENDEEEEEEDMPELSDREEADAPPEVIELLSDDDTENAVNEVVDLEA